MIAAFSLDRRPCVAPKAVARIVPARRDNSVAKQAKARLLTRLERQPIVNVGRWSRDELYDDNV